MGRKIPAKKHRGVKDPLVQQARRLQSLKTKINAPPKDPDDQPMPRSLERLFAFQNKGSLQDKRNTRKKTIQNVEKSKGSGDNPIARLRKLPGETGRGFSLRINSAVRALHGAALLPAAMELDEAADVRGDRMAALRERRARKARRNRAHAAPPPAPPAAAPASRSQRRALHKQAQREKAVARAADEAPRAPAVPFGAVAHAPPALPPPRGAAPRALRPGQRPLLLSALLGGGGAGGGGAGGAARGAGGAAVERARLDAIHAYRLLKAHRNKTNKYT